MVRRSEPKSPHCLESFGETDSLLGDTEHQQQFVLRAAGDWLAIPTLA